MKLSFGKWFSVFFTMVILIAGSSQPIDAQDAGTPEPTSSAPEIRFSAFPEGAGEGVYFEEFIGAGKTHEFRLALHNEGESSLGLLVYPADVYSMTNGGMGVNFQGQGRTEPTTWLDFPEGEVELTAGQELVQPFTVTVPDGTAPGQYVTAIGVETTESFSVGEEGGAFRQKLRKVVAVSILVPGEARPSFALGEPEAIVTQGQTMLRVPVENTGNIRVRPTGTIKLHDSNGGVVATGDVTMGSVYMSDTAPFEIWLPNALPVGEYLVTVELTDPETGVSASLENVAVNVVPEATPEPAVASTPVAEPAATPAAVEPVTLQSIEIEANADSIQFANVAFEIENTGNHISRSRVMLAVSHNGELVEEFEVDDNLPLPVGTTSVEDRYIPPTGWESGTWTFSITVHSINTNANVETVVINAEDVATIEVP
jgi:hypothetical protein